MILSVTEYFHDKEARKYFLDSEKLDKGNPIDALILKKCNNKSKQLEVIYESPQDGEEGYDDDPRPTESAKVKNPASIDKALELIISFDR